MEARAEACLQVEVHAHTAVCIPPCPIMGLVPRPPLRDELEGRDVLAAGIAFGSLSFDAESAAGAAAWGLLARTVRCRAACESQGLPSSMPHSQYFKLNLCRVQDATLPTGVVGRNLRSVLQGWPGGTRTKSCGSSTSARIPVAMAWQLAQPSLMSCRHRVPCESARLGDPRQPQTQQVSEIANDILGGPRVVSPRNRIRESSRPDVSPYRRLLLMFQRQAKASRILAA